MKSRIYGANMSDISIDIRTGRGEGIVRAEIVEALKCTCEKQTFVLMSALLNYYRVEAEYIYYVIRTCFVLWYSSLRSDHDLIRLILIIKVLRELTLIILTGKAYSGGWGVQRTFSNSIFPLG